MPQWIHPVLWRVVSQTQPNRNLLTQRFLYAPSSRRCASTFKGFVTAILRVCLAVMSRCDPDTGFSKMKAMVQRTPHSTARHHVPATPCQKQTRCQKEFCGNFCRIIFQSIVHYQTGFIRAIGSHAFIHSATDSLTNSGSPSNTTVCMLESILLMLCS